MFFIAAPYIFCKGSDLHDNTQDFYLVIGQDRYFLFKQPYRKGVQEYFGNGVSIEKAFNHSWNKLDRAVLRTIDKIPQYIRYVEREYGISVLKQTKKGKNNARRERPALD